MNSSIKSRTTWRPAKLAAAFAALVFAAGASAGKQDNTDLNAPYDSGAIQTADRAVAPSLDSVRGAPAMDSVSGVRVPGLYIIQLAEPPVASYKGGASGIGNIPTIASRGNRPNMRSAQALQYADYLRGKQQQFEGAMRQQFANTSAAIENYQFAFNGLTMRLDAEQLAFVRQHPDVRLVEPVALLDLDTDTGPGFIGAPAIWNGIATGGAPGSRGEGIVFGAIDSGANWESPSFADIGGDGYNHTNPLGAGNYLGVCATEPADPDIGPACNDKVIGAYAKSFDFVQQVNFECANPGDPGNSLGLTPADCAAIGVPLRDFDNALDEGGHGSHTASTAAGNQVDINYLGNNVTISGVANHANIIVYDVCHTNINGQGSCFNFATLAAIDQVVEDGIVDVINYSIGGGTSPWTQANSLAFLAAVDAGVFVSASAGNSGPGAATLGHVEPWVATIAASTHTRGGFNFRYTANGAVPSTPAVSNQPVFLGAVGTAHTTPIVNQPVIISPNIGTTNDGCAAYPPNTFLGAVAVIRRGTCTFAIKVTNAEAAGAISVIIANNQAGNIAPGGSSGVGFPVFGATQAQSDALRDYVNIDNGGVATISIPTVASADAVQGDVMASFSSRGPSAFEALKPDVTAPGVNILAAYVVDPSSPTTASGPDGYNVISGTSMSSPHNAGSAALVRAIHPTWTVAEVKSALMMSSNRTGIVKENGLTTADPFDRGAGRVNLNFAAEAGLVMNETPLNMFQADPANGGDPSTLNIASLQSNSCIGTCTFTRRVRSVASGPVTYTASFVSTSGVAATITPTVFTINPGQSRTLTIDVDVSGSTFNQFNFGDVILTANIIGSGVPYVETVTPGTPVAIPDGAYAGGFDVAGQQGCVSIDTTGDVSGGVFSAQLRAAMTHTWVGDLTLKLRSPSGTILGIMSLPGSNEAADNGLGGSGESANMSAAFPITYRDGAPTSAEAMGADLPTSAGVVCQTAPSACEYSPAPGSVAQPPSNFAGFAGNNAAGVWRFCAGDSVGADVGTITSVTLTVETGSPAAPTAHIPLAVFSVDPSPEITLSPASISQTGQFNGPVVTTTLTIGNVGPVDLNWNENNVPGAASVWQQIEDSTGGIVSDFFQGDASGAYSASDFSFDVETSLTEIFTPGFDNTASLALQPSVTWAIYADAAGVPAGDPETNPGPALWTYTANIGDPEIDITGDDITLDLVAAGEAVLLPAGTYWLTVFPTYTNALAAGNRWNWSQGVAVDAETHLISPVLFGGVPAWTSLTGLGIAWSDTAFELSGIQSCGAPWMSIAPTNGVVAPAGTQAVTVSLDPTGLTPAVYSATLCIASNDPAAPISTVPVSFTVAAPPTDPTGVGLATPANVQSGDTSLLTVTVTPGTNPTSTGLAVSVDLSAVGGAAAQQMFDDGTNGDATAADNVFSVSTAIVGAPNNYTLSASITDAQARTGSATIAITIDAAPTDPTGVGLATPANVQSGDSSLLTVTVTPGANPASTGLAVSVDLTAVGGAAAQQMFDDGTNGDATPGDNVFSFSATIAGAPNTYSLDASITDAEARTGSATIAITIDPPLGDAIFSDGFEDPIIP